jgi:hypothetical protein
LVDPERVLVFVLGIGVALKRYMKTSTDFVLSGRLFSQ